MADRQVVSRERLIQILNETLAQQDQHHACEDVEARKLAPSVRKPDADGCNWTSDSLVWTRLPSHRCRQVLRGVLTELRARYNIA